MRVLCAHDDIDDGTDDVGDGERDNDDLDIDEYKCNGEGVLDDVDIRWNGTGDGEDFLIFTFVDGDGVDLRKRKFDGEGDEEDFRVLEFEGEGDGDDLRYLLRISCTGAADDDLGIEEFAVLVGDRDCVRRLE